MKGHQRSPSWWCSRVIMSNSNYGSISTSETLADGGTWVGQNLGGGGMFEGRTWHWKRAPSNSDLVHIQSNPTVHWGPLSPSRYFNSSRFWGLCPRERVSLHSMQDRDILPSWWLNKSSWKNQRKESPTDVQKNWEVTTETRLLPQGPSFCLWCLFPGIVSLHTCTLILATEMPKKQQTHALIQYEQIYPPKIN